MDSTKDNVQQNNHEYRRLNARIPAEAMNRLKAECDRRLDQEQYAVSYGKVITELIMKRLPAVATSRRAGKLAKTA